MGRIEDIEARVAMPWKGRWLDGVCVCMASGPSLNAEDIATVREWRAAAKGRYATVTNTTFLAATWADALYAHDARWWRMYNKEVRQHFRGARLTRAVMPGMYRLRRLTNKELGPFQNSGCAAISFAMHAGCRKIIMLGYDGKKGPNGEVHHHGDHPRGLGNAITMPQWQGKFDRLARYIAQNYAGVDVVNCSRSTVYSSFRRGDLLEELAC